MRLSDIFVHFLVGGLAGIVVEFFFTGVKSLCYGDKKGTSTSYIWMPPIYGLAYLAMVLLRINVEAPVWLMAFPYALIMFVSEFLYGMLLLKILKVIPWDYGRGRWTIMGAVQLKYAPFWYLLGLCVNPVFDALQRLLDLLAKHG